MPEAVVGRVPVDHADAGKEAIAELGSWRHPAVEHGDDHVGRAECRVPRGFEAGPLGGCAVGEPGIGGSDGQSGGAVPLDPLAVLDRVEQVQQAVEVGLDDIEAGGLALPDRLGDDHFHGGCRVRVGGGSGFLGGCRCREREADQRGRNSHSDPFSSLESPGHAPGNGGASRALDADESSASAGGDEPHRACDLRAIVGDDLVVSRSARDRSQLERSPMSRRV
ncbi:MAG: hypothetical protein R2707_18780 [Acidimicrobiales bacterium]